jgi:hypothetical protein
MTPPPPGYGLRVVGADSGCDEVTYMWIFLGCALAARQWERVWQRTAHGGPVPGQGTARQRTVTWPRLRPGALGAPKPTRQ